MNVNMPPMSVTYMRHSCGCIKPGHALEFDDYTDVLRSALAVQRGDDG